MTVITYAHKFKSNDKTVQGIAHALSLAEKKGTLNEFQQYPTCAPVTCSKYSFVKEIDCAVFEE